MTDMNGDAVPASHNLQMLDVAQLRENDWNPNQMDEDEYEQLVAEVQRLGRVTKPIVVRPVGACYEISDGAHNYRAAKEVGITKVMCDVIEDMTDTEARVQTYMRNQHGTHNPLLEGFMFSGILDSDDELSNRELANRLGASEGKIRRSLKYVEAYEMRRRYAASLADEPLDEDDDEDIRDRVSRLKQRQLECYFKLPDVIRDRWFDALMPAFVSNRLRDSDPTRAGEFVIALERLAASGIAAATPSSWLEFGESYDWMLAVDEWLQERRTVGGLQEYVVSCAPWLLPIQFLDLLPCQYQESEGKVVIPLDQWSEFVVTACRRYEGVDDRYATISTRVSEWLRENGVNKSDVCGLEAARLSNELPVAPALLRNATILAVEERVSLFREIGEEPDERAREALQSVLSEVQARRVNDDGDSEAAAPAGESVVEMFQSTLRELERNDLIAVEDELFGDGREIHAWLKQWLDESDILRGSQINERPAAAVLAERLEGIALPERILLVAAIAESTAIPIEERWLAAVELEAAA